MEKVFKNALASICFPTLESVTNVIEMELVSVTKRRVRFAIDDEFEIDTWFEIDVQLQEELDGLWAAQQSRIAAPPATVVAPLVAMT